MQHWKRGTLAAVTGAVLITTVSSAFAASTFGIDPRTGRTATETMLLEYGDKGDYDIVPLITAGDEVPLLMDDRHAAHPRLRYRIAGAMDGMGLIEEKGFKWLVLQHEYDGDGPRFENPFGRLYQIDLNIADPLEPSSWSSTITYLLQGGPGKGMSYDNVAATGAGIVLLAEDLNKDSDEADSVWNVLKAEQRYLVLAGYHRYEGSVDILFELNMLRHDPQVDWDRLNDFIAEGDEGEARDAEFWEASGMIEVPSASLPEKPAYLIGVQASSLVPSGMVEGGQVVLARPVSTRTIWRPARHARQDWSPGRHHD